jgi:hypothetical protein
MQKRVGVNTNVRFSIQSVGHKIWVIVWCYRRHYDTEMVCDLCSYLFFKIRVILRRVRKIAKSDY